MAIARDDLGRHRLGPQSDEPQRPALDGWAEVGVGPYRTRYLAHRDLVARRDQGPLGPAHLSVETGKRQTRHHGLGMHPVRTADHQGLAMLICLARQRRAQLIDAGQDVVGGFAQQEGEGGVEHV